MSVLKLGQSTVNTVKTKTAPAVAKVKSLTLGDWGSLASIGGLLYVGYELFKKKR